MLKFSPSLLVTPLATRGPLWLAIVVTLGFAAVARLVRGVTASGAIAGAVVALLLYTCAGPAAFISLISVFILAWITTRLGYAQKERRGTAERKDGRNALQVLANLGTATVCAVSYAFSKNSIFLIATTAAMAEAAADTVSSEYGQAAAGKAFLITTWEEVLAGTDGGISLPGTLAGVTAAVLITSANAATGLIGWGSSWISVLAAVLGMLADSFLGASLERQRILSNNAVNFLSTVVAALLAIVLAKSVG